jgi:hypothetical protein
VLANARGALRSMGKESQRGKVEALLAKPVLCGKVLRKVAKQGSV